MLQNSSVNLVYEDYGWHSEYADYDFEGRAYQPELWMLAAPSYWLKNLAEDNWVYEGYGYGPD